MLFGEDINATTTDLPEVLSFQHKLIQEYLAAVYITETLKQDISGAYLKQAFPTWEKIVNHREVVQFACGMLAETDSSPIINHVAKVISEFMEKEINEGEHPAKQNIFQDGTVSPSGRTILEAFQREGGAPLVTPYLAWYPACGRPLAEVLANNQLVIITDIDENDTLQLKPSPAQIILHLNSMSSDKFDRLWQGFDAMHANIIDLSLHAIKSKNRVKLANFRQLKRFHMIDVDASELGDLAQSIDNWGPPPQVVYFCLNHHINSELDKTFQITEPLMMALSRCMHLKHLNISNINLHAKLYILMAFPPTDLTDLTLFNCSLDAEDISHLTRAFKEDGLAKLQVLDIRENPIGQGAVGSLLKVISIRPHALKHLKLLYTSLKLKLLYTSPYAFA